MKAISAMLLSVLVFSFFPICVDAEMISIRDALCHQNEGILNKWERVYEAYGRTITVNVPIIIPNVENLPVLKVSAAEGYLTAQRNNLKKSEDQENAGDGIFYDDYSLIPKILKSAAKEERVNVFVSDPDKRGQDAFMQATYNKPSSFRRGGWDYFDFQGYYPSEIEFELTYADKNEISLAEAQDVLDRILIHYFGEGSEAEIEYVEIRGRAKNKQGDYKDDYPTGTYQIFFRQKAQGIPIYLDIGSKMLSTDKTRITPDVGLKCEPIIGLKVNTFEFMNYGSFYLDSKWLSVKEIVEEDVPILSADCIVSRIENVIKEGRIREVFALRLGYVCYLDRYSPDTYILHPCWICDCIITDSAKDTVIETAWTENYRESPNYEQIIIDAQTGEIQMGWIKENEGLYHNEPITWE